MELVAKGIRSGVLNDLGSGSNVDLCVITKDKVEYLRNYEYLQGKTYSRQFPVKYPAGTASECGSQREGGACADCDGLPKWGGVARCHRTCTHHRSFACSVE